MSEPHMNRQAKHQYIQDRLSEDLETKETVAFLHCFDDSDNGAASGGPAAQSAMRLPVKTGINLVGAARNSASICLDIKGVSGLHALIEVSADGAEHFIEDIESTNGTSIGLSQFVLTPRRLYQLTHNKIIHFGPARCRYEMRALVPDIPVDNTRNPASEMDLFNAAGPSDSVAEPAGRGSVRVLFTGLPELDERAQIVEMLGGIVVDNWDDCTHLVTDRIRRTVKFLCALSAGKHIMGTKWLETSKKEGRFVEEAKFILRDPAAEKQYRFSLKKSLQAVQRPDARPLFASRTVFRTPSVKPGHDDLREILTSAGGTLINDRSKVTSDTIVIADPADAADFADLRRSVAALFNSEIVLTSILRQELDLDQRGRNANKSSQVVTKVNFPARSKMLRAASVTELRRFWEGVGRQQHEHSFSQGGSGTLSPEDDTIGSLSHAGREVVADTPCANIGGFDALPRRPVFALKTLVVNDAKVHEIEFCCTACRSAFVLRAAHHCTSDKEQATQQPPAQQQGLEWLRDQRREHVNLVI
nr:Mediator of DNA damage checkpoint protein 1 [Polyrhizophydium stewartii]